MSICWDEVHLVHIKSQKLNLMQKTKVALNHGGREVYPQYLLEFLLIMLQYSIQILCNF